MVSGLDPAYQQICSEITAEFSDCSKQVGLLFSIISINLPLIHKMAFKPVSISLYLVQVLEMESLFLRPDCSRDDLALLLRSVQIQEKQKLNLVSLSLFLLVYT